MMSQRGERTQKSFPQLNKSNNEARPPPWKNSRPDHKSKEPNKPVEGEKRLPAFNEKREPLCLAANNMGITVEIARRLTGGNL
jgi:hypothetical protein